VSLLHVLFFTLISSNLCKVSFFLDQPVQGFLVFSTYFIFIFIVFADFFTFAGLYGDSSTGLGSLYFVDRIVNGTRHMF
jgi:hypothetical protein